VYGSRSWALAEADRTISKLSHLTADCHADTKSNASAATTILIGSFLDGYAQNAGRCHAAGHSRLQSMEGSTAAAISMRLPIHTETVAVWHQRFLGLKLTCYGQGVRKHSLANAVRPPEHAQHARRNLSHRAAEDLVGAG
jgi:hypothetical protein